jgi:hypothetical protein
MGVNMDAGNPGNEGNSGSGYNSGGSGYNSDGNGPNKPLDKGKGKAISSDTEGNAPNKPLDKGKGKAISSDTEGNAPDKPLDKGKGKAVSSDMEDNAPDKPLDKGKGKAVSLGTGGNNLPYSLGIPGLDAEALRFLHMNPSQLSQERKNLGMLDTTAKENTAEVLDRLSQAVYYVENTSGIKQSEDRGSLIAQRYMQIVIRTRESTPSASDSGSPSSNYSGSGFPVYNASDPR